MPVHAKAQRREPGVVFVFANQREGPELIRRYLEAAGLELRNVLLDAKGRLPRETGSRDGHRTPIRAARIAEAGRNFAKYPPWTWRNSEKDGGATSTGTLGDGLYPDRTGDVVPEEDWVALGAVVVGQ